MHIIGSHPKVPTPWPCFSIAARSSSASEQPEQLLKMLEIVRAEAAALAADTKNRGEIIGRMNGQTPEDVESWLAEKVQWSCQPVVSFAVLENVMRSLCDAGVLETEQLLSPEQLVADVCQNGDP